MLPAPAYYHCDLLRDEAGVRLARQHDALSLRTLRQQGHTPEQILNSCISGVRPKGIHKQTL